MNEEANLDVLSESFAAAHTEVFEQDKQWSREVTFSEWRRRPVKEKVLGNAGRVLRSQV